MATAPAVCDLKVPVGDEDRTWVYYWRYPTAVEIAWGHLAQSVAYHARGYELSLDSDIRRADVIEAIERLFRASEPERPLADLDLLLRTLAMPDIDSLAQDLEDHTELEVEVEIGDGDLSIMLIGSDGALGDTVAFDTTRDDFWSAIDALESAYRALAAYCQLGRDIQEFEGFPVSLVGPDDLTVAPVSWPFSRAAKSSWTLSDWIKGRFEQVYPGCTPLVIGPDNAPVHGNTRLGTLRRMATEDRLLEPQFHADGWLA